jgi:hypothetical protein
MLDTNTVKYERVCRAQMGDMWHIFEAMFLKCYTQYKYNITVYLGYFKITEIKLYTYIIICISDCIRALDWWINLLNAHKS